MDTPAPRAALSVVSDFFDFYAASLEISLYIKSYIEFASIFSQKVLHKNFFMDRFNKIASVVGNEALRSFILSGQEILLYFCSRLSPALADTARYAAAAAQQVILSGCRFATLLNNCFQLDRRQRHLCLISFGGLAICFGVRHCRRSSLQLHTKNPSLSSAISPAFSTNADGRISRITQASSSVDERCQPLACRQSIGADTVSFIQERHALEQKGQNQQHSKSSAAQFSKFGQSDRSAYFLCNDPHTTAPQQQNNQPFKRHYSSYPSSIRQHCQTLEQPLLPLQPSVSPVAHISFLEPSPEALQTLRSPLRALSSNKLTHKNSSNSIQRRDKQKDHQSSSSLCMSQLERVPRNDKYHSGLSNVTMTPVINITVPSTGSQRRTVAW